MKNWLGLFEFVEVYYVVSRCLSLFLGLLFTCFFRLFFPGRNLLESTWTWTTEDCWKVPCDRERFEKKVQRAPNSKIQSSVRFKVYSFIHHLEGYLRVIYYTEYLHYSTIPSEEFHWFAVRQDESRGGRCAKDFWRLPRFCRCRSTHLFGHSWGAWIFCHFFSSCDFRTSIPKNPNMKKKEVVFSRSFSSKDFESFSMSSFWVRWIPCSGSWRHQRSLQKAWHRKLACKDQVTSHYIIKLPWSL